MTAVGHKLSLEAELRSSIERLDRHGSAVLSTSFFCNSCSKGNVPRTMDSFVSETALNAFDDFTARDEFLGKNRSLRPSDRTERDSGFGDEAEAEAMVCLDHVVWSNLPEELLIHIFARLPVMNILPIRTLSKSWRSTITSPQFQQAFSEASVVRISLLAKRIQRCPLYFHGESTPIYFNQANRWESYQPSNRKESYRHSAETVFKYPYDIAGTANGLICVIELEQGPVFSRLINLRVFVKNLVTGIRRELPSPRIKTERPTLVQMKANVNDGYTIAFIYTKDHEDLRVTSLQVYDSVKNIWSNDEGRAIADFKDVEVFNMSCSWNVDVYYDVPATFRKETKPVSVFNLYEGDERHDPQVYPSNPNGHVHNVSGELYELCTQEGRHGVWKRALLCSSRWEMVCECPDLEGVWTCLRVMNDWVVLIIELPVPYQIFEFHDRTGKVDRKYCFHGSIVKVFHMPTKVWHSFPEHEHFISRFVFRNPHNLFINNEYPFLVEARFDSVP